jgi:integrase
MKFARKGLTGLRRGELIGLRWENVDFEQLILHVRKSVVARVEGTPKTEASKKHLPLDVQTAESLFAWRARPAHTLLRVIVCLHRRL